MGVAREIVKMTVNAQSSGRTEFLSACPGCGDISPEILREPSEYKVFVTGADEVSVTTGVCGCKSCGLIFLNPRMGHEALFEYYSKQSRLPRDEIVEGSPFAELMELQLDLIERFKPLEKGMKVLEIGCAEGFFLQSLAKRADFSLKLYGVELSANYLDQFHRILPDATIFKTPLEGTDFGDLKFDLIVLRHVFEHLNDPVRILEKIRSVLAPEGALYIEVPDSENTDPSLCSFYHHEHLLYFTTLTLSSYLKSSGFEPEICERFNANPVGSGFTYPVIRSLSMSALPTPLVSYPGYAKKIHNVNEYSNASAIDALLAHVLKSLHHARENGKTVGLFGGGPHTMELLTLLKNEDITWVKIFDNNHWKHGKLMFGIPIVKPDEVSLKSVDCILVSSAEFEKEMVEQIRALAGSQIEVIRIYENS